MISNVNVKQATESRKQQWLETYIRRGADARRSLFNKGSGEFEIAFPIFSRSIDIRPRG